MGQLAGNEDSHLEMALTVCTTQVYQVNFSLGVVGDAGVLSAARLVVTDDVALFLIPAYYIGSLLINRVDAD